MAAKLLPSQDELRQLLRYDPDTGKLFWRKRDASRFNDGKQSATHNCRAWNARFSGKEALCAIDRGYKHGRVDYEKVYAHRVIWKLVHGVEPDVIDHINGNPEDNRLSNLRSVSQALNCRNAARVSNGKPAGVNPYLTRSGDRRWSVHICGKHMKSFVCLGEALAARRIAEIKHAYHPNHGRRIAEK